MTTLSSGATSWFGSLPDSGVSADLQPVASGGTLTYKIIGGAELQFGNAHEIVASQTPSAAGGVSLSQEARLYAAVFAPSLSGLAPGTAASTAENLAARGTVLADISQSSEFMNDVAGMARLPASAQHRPLVA